MNFYTKQHRFYCGVDLHARSMFVCILSHDGEIVLHRDLPAQPEPFLQTIGPYREDIVVAVQCIFTWYWLADLCRAQNIPCILGHALYMKAIRGGKAKNDRIESRKIAGLLRGDLLAHTQNTNSQCNLPEFGQKIAHKVHRQGVADRFADPCVRKSIELDIELIDHLDLVIDGLERFLLRTARQHDPNALHLLQTVPGIGKTLSLVILYEIHDIGRFPTVGDFASYARLVKCAKESAGKRLGSSGRKIGNVHLKWAFSEAATLFVRCNPEGLAYKRRLEKKHGKAKALAIIAHKLGRATYYMLQRGRALEMQKFLAA